MEIWSLDAVPGGRASRRSPTPPEAWECDDPRWPPIPAQDFSNLPRQQKGLHAKGFEYMRLSERARGTHLELRTDHRRLPRRPSLRAAAPGAAGGQREPAREADRRPRLLSVSTEHDVRRRRRGRPRHDRRVHPGARRRPDRRRRRHLLPRRRRATSRAWAPTTATTRSARPTPKWKPRRPQRHLVVNTLVTDWNDHEANAISDVVFLLQGDAGWAIQVVGRYHDTLHHDDGTWRFHRRAASS